MEAQDMLDPANIFYPITPEPGGKANGLCRPKDDGYVHELTVNNREVRNILFLHEIDKHMMKLVGKHNKDAKEYTYQRIQSLATPVNPDEHRSKQIMDMLDEKD